MDRRFTITRVCPIKGVPDALEIGGSLGECSFFMISSDLLYPIEITVASPDHYRRSL